MTTVLLGAVLAQVAAADPTHASLSSLNCDRQLGDLAFQERERPEVREVRRFHNASRLLEEYTVPDATRGTLAAWEARNQERASRQFRLTPLEEEAHGSHAQAVAGREMALQRKLILAREAVARVPESDVFHTELAKLTQNFLEHTGVFSELVPADHGPAHLTITPLSQARWRERTEETFGSRVLATLESRPNLTFLAERLQREALELRFVSKDLAKKTAAGHYTAGSHIALGTPDLFLLGLDSAYFHELGHHQHYKRSQLAWTSEQMQPASLPASDQAPRPFPELATLPQFPRVLKLPYIDLRGIPKRSLDLFSERIKGSPYEKRHLIEEAANTYREAVYHLARARKFKRIAESTGLIEAKDLALVFAKRALDRSGWVPAFTNVAAEFFEPLRLDGHPDPDHLPFYLTASGERHFDSQLNFKDGKKIDFSSAQIPAFARQSDDRKDKLRNLHRLLEFFGDDLRRTLIKMEFEMMDFRRALASEFGVKS